MTRWVGRGLILLILLLAVLFPAVRWGSGGDVTPDNATITDYAADFIVAGDGRLSVTETLKVSFPVDKHGIFRFFDLEDPNDSHVRLRPRNISVTRDGQSEPFEVLHEGQGRYRDVKIGSPSVTMSGEHLYVIRYTINGVISPAGDGSQFYWNLVPGGWRMPIERTTLTVHLPAEAKKLQCAVGNGASAGCTATPDAANSFVVTTGRLAPNTPVTVKAGMDLAAPERDRTPWPLRFDPVLGPSTIALIALLVLAAFAAWMGQVLAMQTREPKPRFPLMYAPPDGIGPAQANYLLNEKVGTDDFVATIMHTSETGATSLKRSDGWTIADTGKAASWARLDPVSTYAATVLGVQGGSFTADDSVGAGKKLKSALSKFESATKDWARQNNLMTRAGLGSFGGIMVILSFVLALFIAVANPFDLSVIALVPGLFAVFAAELLASGSGTKRTAAGRELWSRIGGFRRVLATTSGEQRFDFSGRKELYTAYIPWAVAFGVADQWAEKYRVETGEEPPQPFYAATSGFHAGSGGFASAMADDFSSTVGSAISAYEATQSSSSGGSSGGGGFSGGGGGGGGGGGSW
jgi:uncharacterized membrane protein YgcG